MLKQMFPHSRVVPYRDFELELAKEGVSNHAELLESFKDEVLRIAAISRGWNDPADHAFFRKYFKIEPLFEADSLALVRKNGLLAGLAGAVNNWHVEEGSIVHLCSLGFLPEIQKRGFLPTFFSILWQVSLADPVTQRDYHQGRLFTTAITQSPFILWLMRNLGDSYPSPDRTGPGLDEIKVARHVTARFDPGITFDEEAFILRNECKFRYRRIPYSPDRKLNHFCDQKLRYNEGDVFVMVGRISPERLQSFLDRIQEAYPDLMNLLCKTLLT
jgi:hypothetical protein